MQSLSYKSIRLYFPSIKVKTVFDISNFQCACNLKFTTFCHRVVATVTNDTLYLRDNAALITLCQIQCQLRWL